jgi:hypothetical protein
MHQKKPSIHVVLRGARFARNVCANTKLIPDSSAGSFIDRRAQHVGQLASDLFGQNAVAF